MRPRRLLTAALGVAAATALLDGPCPLSAEEARRQVTTFPTLPLELHVGRVDGVDVVTGAWLDEQVGWANEIFSKHGVSFAVVGRSVLDERYSKLETRADRHALAAFVSPNVVNCFIVESMRDVDDPSQWRRGVHWRPPGRGGRHYVVLTSIAGPRVLAHELGHFFGNRAHSPTPGNIMSYEPAEGVPFFDERQVAKVHRTLRRMLAARELVPVAALARGRSGPRRHRGR